MKVAVVQLALRTSPEAHVEGLAGLAGQAAEAGVELAVFPEVLSLGADATRDDVHRAIQENASCVSYLMPQVGPDARGRTFTPLFLEGMEQVGLVAMPVGDACFDLGYLDELGRAQTSMLVMSPRSESDLQAEAALEFAIGLSECVAPLVMVSDCAGAQPGERGHGGSAIVLLGEVMAEAGDGDDVLVADVPLPIPRAEPPAPLPDLPPILAQRLAVHEGRKPEVDYPADLS